MSQNVNKYGSSVLRKVKVTKNDIKVNIIFKFVLCNNGKWQRCIYLIVGVGWYKKSVHQEVANAKPY